MSDVVLLEVIKLTGIFITAMMTMVTTWLTLRNARDIATTKRTIVTLEKNTNSIKDALVKVTGEAEFAKGLKEGTAASNAAENPK